MDLGQLRRDRERYVQIFALLGSFVSADKFDRNQAALCQVFDNAGDYTRCSDNFELNFANTDRFLVARRRRIGREGGAQNLNGLRRDRYGGRRV